MADVGLTGHAKAYLYDSYIFGGYRLSLFAGRYDFMNMAVANGSDWLASLLNNIFIDIQRLPTFDITVMIKPPMHLFRYKNRGLPIRFGVYSKKESLMWADTYYHFRAGRPYT